MQVEVKVPQLSESVSEATLVAWRKKAGEPVKRDENLIDVETDKVVLELPAPVDGVLSKIVKKDGESVTSGEVIAVIDTEAKATASAAPAAEPMPDWGSALPAANAGHGKEISGRCEQCHDLSKGGPNKIGPNLWGVVGRPRAEHPGFSYSSAMSASHDPWSYDKLFVFLKAPQAEIPGTKMSFAGLRSSQDRIDLLAYLRTQSDIPAPIPAAKK
jgi:cytochrome c2